MNIRKLIIETAANYVDIKEIGQNQWFDNEIFAQKLQGVGWVIGQPYCMFTGKLIWCEAYGKSDSSFISVLNKIISPSAVTTYNNFKRSRKFKTGYNAEPGDLVFWQKYIKGVPSWQGHNGVVIDSSQLFFKTFEGNTNIEGSRDGGGNYYKTRNYDFYEDNGLRLLGFVKPKEV